MYKYTYVQECIILTLQSPTNVVPRQLSKSDSPHSPFGRHCLLALCPVLLFIGQGHGITAGVLRTVRGH